MSDFQFIQNLVNKQWVVLAPRRASRPDETKEVMPICPFCLGQETVNKEVYRIGGKKGDENWQIRVITNKYPFAPVHEVIVHSSDHHKNIDELPLEHVKTVFFVYKQRYLTYQKLGQVYIFQNRGEQAGESLPHPHSQLVVIPNQTLLEIPTLHINDDDVKETKRFILFCPLTSQWPDEVWVAPKLSQRTFGEITDGELDEFSYVMQRLLQLWDMRHGHEFPYNYYIYPGRNWYLRLIPRFKTLGGFEVGTNVYVNTQDPKETIAFLKQHFENPDEAIIRKHHRALYMKSV